LFGLFLVGWVFWFLGLLGDDLATLAILQTPPGKEENGRSKIHGGVSGINQRPRKHSREAPHLVGELGGKNLSPPRKKGGGF